MDVISFDEDVAWVDLVITGEGKIDSQTLCNKAPYAVAQRARKYGKKVIGIAGSTECLENSPFAGVFSIINQACTLEYAIQNTDSLVYGVAKELTRLISGVSG